MSHKPKKQNRFYDSYIPRLLRSNGTKNGITGNARMQLNSVLCYVTDILATKSRRLASVSNRRTVSEKEILNSLRLCFPGELSDAAHLVAEVALNKYESSTEEKGTSRHVKADLVFPPAVPEKYLREFGASQLMVTQGAPIALCAAVQFFAHRILEGATAKAKKKGKVRVTINDLFLSSREDAGISTVFRENNLYFVGGGSVPFIHPSLKKKRKTKKRRRDPDAPVTRHRYKPGTVALRDIKKFQKVSDCLILAKAPFEKLVRKILQNYGSDASKISKQVFIVLQYHLESKLIDTLAEANLAALHAGRIKVLPEDIDFVVSLKRRQKSISLKRLEDARVHASPDPEENDDGEASSS